jgi:hypothetical protein
MAVNENDLQLIQTYLDGEMPTSECEGLWRRLAVEPELAAELEKLRADVANRQMVWTSLEPADEMLAELQRNILKNSRKQNVREIAGRRLRGFASVAAMLLFGFGIGWMGRDRFPGLGSSLMTTPSSTSVPASSLLGGSGVWQVNIKDASGKVIATQRFNTREEAMHFADDINKAEASHPTNYEMPLAPSGNQF